MKKLISIMLLSMLVINVSVTKGMEIAESNDNGLGIGCVTEESLRHYAEPIKPLIQFLDNGKTINFVGSESTFDVGKKERWYNAQLRGSQKEDIEKLLLLKHSIKNGIFEQEIQDKDKLLKDLITCTDFNKHLEDKNLAIKESSKSIVDDLILPLRRSFIERIHGYCATQAMQDLFSRVIYDGNSRNQENGQPNKELSSSPKELARRIHNKISEIKQENKELKENLKTFKKEVPEEKESQLQKENKVKTPTSFFSKSSMFRVGGGMLMGAALLWAGQYAMKTLWG